jgi:nicotinate-nucleotide--dimethylbenzimidazole phosphoribosyltransferase
MTTVNTTSLQEQLHARINTKTKPVGSLGRLEEIAIKAGLIQQTTHPVITNPHIIVFAGDHGIAQTGLVNAYPQEVTAQMVLNFLNGGAAINVFCRQHNIRLQVVDAGVNFDFSSYSESRQLIHAKIGSGTSNYLEQPAMSEEAVNRAIERGKEIVESSSADGCNCIGFGEMGIGNTSSASLIMSAITGLPLAECVGRGAGVSDEQLQTKIQTLQKVYDRHQLQTLADKPFQLLSCVGGFEIAMMAGAYLKAAEQRMIIIADGFIATAALLVAKTIYPKLLDYCLFAHTSQEQGHEKMLRYLDVQPLLQLGLRLGEGTGAALAIPLVQSAVNFLQEMASFESAGVSNKE